MFKRFIKTLLSRPVIAGILFLSQIALIYFAVAFLSRAYLYVTAALHILSFAVVVYIINTNWNPTYKVTWIVPILLFPVIGGLFYLIIQVQTVRRAHRRKLKQIVRESAPYIAQDRALFQKIFAEERHVANIVEYMRNWGGYSVVQKTKTRYLQGGETVWRRMLAELEKAERYIFLEYFTVQEGVMWDAILEILIKKAKQGVDVRLLYDALGSLGKLPDGYCGRMKDLGIQCHVFNPFVPFLSTYQNNRDHRKLCAIDGCVAFCGGNNIADEYINVVHPFGHWRDTAVMLEGAAAYNISVMFLQMWRMGDDTPVDYDRFRPTAREKAHFVDDGYVMAFGDAPLDDETVGEFVYLDIINTAKDYVYITTPYLILDYYFLCALKFAAKRGVDVKIILPGIPDKWYTEVVAESYFEELIKDGVEIYKYVPGFIHSKLCVSDRKTAVVGSINLDYRSFYFHYESAVWMHGSGAVHDVHGYFVNAVSEYCRKVSLEESRDLSFVRRILRIVLRLFAPLM